MQIICTLLRRHQLITQKKFFAAWMLFLTNNQQSQSTVLQNEINYVIALGCFSYGIIKIIRAFARVSVLFVKSLSETKFYIYSSIIFIINTCSKLSSFSTMQWVGERWNQQIFRPQTCSFIRFVPILMLLHIMSWSLSLTSEI